MAFDPVRILQAVDVFICCFESGGELTTQLWDGGPGVHLGAGIAWGGKDMKRRADSPHFEIR